MILANTGALLFDVALPGQGTNGNGIGVPAAPDGRRSRRRRQPRDRRATFDHGIDVFTVPGSGENCLLWATGRGNLLRNGMGPSTAAVSGDPRRPAPRR